MPSKRLGHDGKARRLASGRQLWALNREGLLQLVPVANNANVLNSTDADKAIKASMAGAP